MRTRSIACFAVLLALGAGPAFGQADAWQRKWFWGGHGSVFQFQTPTDASRHYAYGGGAHWLITGKRSALFAGFDQWIFPSSTQSVVADASVPSGVRVVDFTQGRRITAILYAVPSDAALQVMLGGGFSIHQVTNGVAQGPFATLSEAVNTADLVAEASTRAFAVAAAGFQFRMGRLAFFGHYNFMPSASTFLISAGQHIATAGIRYSLTSSHEDVTAAR